jgi:hypothetical protein
VEHLCHQCGAPVEDGVSFCPACAAPQIRVSAPLNEVPATPSVPSVVLPGQVAWPFALRTAAIAGGTGAFLCLLMAPILKAGFVLGMVLGGAMCVGLYRRRLPLARITSSMGARLGAVAGLFGFAVYAVVQSILLLAAPNDELRQALHDAIQQAIKQNPDPKAQEMAKALLTPEGTAFIVVLVMLALLAMFLIFGVIGGSLWASLQKRDQK